MTYIIENCQVLERIICKSTRIDQSIYKSKKLEVICIVSAPKSQSPPPPPPRISGRCFWRSANVSLAKCYTTWFPSSGLWRVWRSFSIMPFGLWLSRSRKLVHSLYNYTQVPCLIYRGCIFVRSMGFRSDPVSGSKSSVSGLNWTWVDIGICRTFVRGLSSCDAHLNYSQTSNSMSGYPRLHVCSHLGVDLECKNDPFEQVSLERWASICRSSCLSIHPSMQTLLRLYLPFRLSKSEHYAWLFLCLSVVISVALSLYNNIVELLSDLLFPVCPDAVILLLSLIELAGGMFYDFCEIV